MVDCSFSAAKTTLVLKADVNFLRVVIKVNLRVDFFMVKNELAPVWFSKYRSRLFAIYMGITATLFGIYLTRLE